MSSCHSADTALYRFKWCLFDSSCAFVWGCKCVHACWFRWHKCRPHKKKISSINTWLLYAWPAFITIILLFVQCFLWCVCETCLSNRVSQNVTKVRSEADLGRVCLEPTNSRGLRLLLIIHLILIEWIVRYGIHVNLSLGPGQWEELYCSDNKPKGWWG